MSDAGGFLTTDALMSASPRQLLATYESILVELRRRNLVRTNDAPAGQYAEWLAQQVFGGTLADNSVKSYDLDSERDGKIQVKCRVVRNPTKAGERQLSPFRSFDFTHALVVLFDASYNVRRAVLLPPDIIKAHARESKHVNGWIAIARDSLLDLGDDVTARFAAASEATP